MGRQWLAGCYCSVFSCSRPTPSQQSDQSHDCFTVVCSADADPITAVRPKSESKARDVGFGVEVSLWLMSLVMFLLQTPFQQWSHCQRIQPTESRSVPTTTSSVSAPSEHSVAWTHLRYLLLLASSSHLSFAVFLVVRWSGTVEEMWKSSAYCLISPLFV